MSPTRQSTTTRSRRLAAAAGSALLLSGLLSGCGLIGGSAPSAEVGDCMKTAELEAQQGEVTDLPTVECSEAHDAEVLTKFEMADGDWPGSDKIEEEVGAKCVPDFASYIGEDIATSENFDIYMLTPTEETWGKGDHEVICVVYSVDGTTTTTSFKGAGA